MGDDDPRLRRLARGRGDQVAVGVGQLQAVLAHQLDNAERQRHAGFLEQAADGTVGDLIFRQRVEIAFVDRAAGRQD